MTYEYLKDPKAIYEKSFATVAAEADLDRLPEDLRPVATRIIHACGMVDLADDLRYAPEIVARTAEALNQGAIILCDCEMVRSGIIARFLPGNERLTTLNDAQTPERAQLLGTTRSAAAVELWRPHIDGAVVIIGNAPTALFHVLTRCREGWPKPAAILGFPVGFVGAAESKEALVENPDGIPFLTLAGRRGGSAMAAAALNAISQPLRGTG